MAWTKLATIGELPKDSVIEVEHKGDLYAICNAGGELRALSGVCPHEGGPLGQGTVTEGILVCPWHMWEFDSRSGACLIDDSLAIPIYGVKVEEGAVLVDLPDHA
jgi:nitrite reductase/ring-hydroxylating ferredoxin subunit